ncbi:MAG: hypothetical protein LBE61_09830 [Burkholderiaceae bacterium]|nr:hypothetical protein [Burkholderiaceae bacterium]
MPDQSELEEFRDLNDELYSSVLPAPRSTVAVYNALADRLGLLGPDGMISEELRRFAGAIVVRCAEAAGGTAGEQILKQLLPEPLEQAKATMAAYRAELDEELRNTGGGRVQ